MGHFGPLLTVEQFIEESSTWRGLIQQDTARSEDDP